MTSNTDPRRAHRTDPRRPLRTSARRPIRTTLGVAAAAALLLGGLTACSTGGTSGADNDKVQVVAAENVWGSLAAQLGGDRVQVTNIIDNVSADPHDFEPTAADARAIATADLVIVNGAGYDAWATKLVDANPAPERVLLDVGELVGAEGHDHSTDDAASGDDGHDHAADEAHDNDANPHLWYDPTDVKAVVAQLTKDLQKVAPEHSDEFASLNKTFTTEQLAPYEQAIADIKAEHAGTAVGASESFFAMLAPALGLDLITPAGFVNAVSEGIEPRADAKIEADAQIAKKQIAVYVSNTQNATPDARSQAAAAERAGIPVVDMTETLNPPTATFQAWQTAQLRALETALDASAS